MIGTEDLLKLIKIVIYTGRLKGERPISLLIVASVGGGKSSMIKKLFQLDGILYTTDITPYALHKRHGNELRDGSIKHIVIPDFLNSLNKSKDQVNNFIVFMNSLIEEGVSRIESRNSNFSIPIPVSVGLITSIAQQDFDKRKEKFATVGFLSRMIPVSYKYGVDTIEDIFDSIYDGEYRDDPDFILDLPPDMDIQLDKQLAVQLRETSVYIKDEKDIYGFRRQKQLQTLAKAHALGRGRDSVTKEDIDHIRYYARYMNYDCKQEL